MLGSTPAPEPATNLVVVGSTRREQPGWDGEIHPVVGIVDPTDRGLLSVPPRLVAETSELARRTLSVDVLREALPSQLQLGQGWVYRATYRWSTGPPESALLPDAGSWVPTTDARLPAWLHPFGGNALVAFDGDPATAPFLAGVGLKRHDSSVHEIAVGTEQSARGRGLARRLVAQAARELLAAGVIPTYLHDPSNVASARVADAAGFPDLGWTMLGLARP